MCVQFGEIDLFAIKFACSLVHPAKSSGSNDLYNGMTQRTLKNKQKNISLLDNNIKR